jgi:hypothetical protein
MLGNISSVLGATFLEMCLEQLCRLEHGVVTAPALITPAEVTKTLSYSITDPPTPTPADLTKTLSYSIESPKISRYTKAPSHPCLHPPTHASQRLLLPGSLLKDLDAPQHASQRLLLPGSLLKDLDALWDRGTRAHGLDEALEGQFVTLQCGVGGDAAPAHALLLLLVVEGFGFRV